MAIPRTQPSAYPAILSYGFRPFFLLGSLQAGLAILMWLPLYYGKLATLKPVCACGLAYPRTALWLSDGSHYRVPAYRNPELDGTTAGSGFPLGPAGIDLDRGPGRRVLLAGNRLAPERSNRLLISCCRSGCSSGGNHRRSKLAEPQGAVAGRDPSGGKCPVSCRSPFRRDIRYEPPPRPGSGRHSRHGYRRPHHTELHPQLAGSRKAGTAPDTLWQIRCWDDRAFRGGACGVDRLS